MPIEKSHDWPGKPGIVAFSLPLNVALFPE
jgi:hypothetical protein